MGPARGGKSLGEEKRVDRQSGEQHAVPAVPDANGVEQADQSKRRRKADPVGRALRVAYEDTLREDVPTDFLDLLGKLD